MTVLIDMKESAHSEIVRQHYDLLAPAFLRWSWYNDKKIEDAIVELRPIYAKLILDLCSGPGGTAAALLRDRNIEQYDMVDISPRTCELARGQLGSDPRVSIHCGTWTIPVHGKKYDAIILKNSLHLIYNLRHRLEQLRRYLTSIGTVIIVETISPNATANAFIKEVFRFAGLDEYKVNYFTEKSLMDELAQSGLIQSGRSIIIDQEINVNDWLDSKVIGDLRRRNTLEYIIANHNNPQISRAMRINICDDGRITMLRKQLCAAFHFGS
jgi:ubiquinone/menaquinone biosynthesis C-methylase UbiE